MVDNLSNDLYWRIIYGLSVLEYVGSSLVAVSSLMAILGERESADFCMPRHQDIRLPEV